MLRTFTLVSAVVLAGCASAPMGEGERELTSAAASAPVQAKVGEVFIVRLASNASTGYSWTWDPAAAGAALVQDGEPAMSGLDPQRVGSGGTQTWRFRAISPGDAQLRLEYRRPWEKDVPPAQTVNWRIQVR